MQLALMCKIYVNFLRCYLDAESKLKNYHLLLVIVGTGCIIILNPSNSYASTCAVKETIYSAPQFFLLSDNVFAGTVTSITDYGNHQWQVHFDIEKIWKGVATRQTSTVMTNTLQACGYSIAVGEKYLIYTNGSPSFINTVYSKMYSDAQDDIALFDDPKFQSQEQVKEALNKKLEVAKGRVGSMMMDKLSPIPIVGVGVDQVNSTLDIMIDDQRATFSIEKYRQDLKDILGDIPIKVEFGHATTLAPILHSIDDQRQTTSYPVIHGSISSNVLKSPLKQFKSGLSANHMTCKKDLYVILKAENSFPACVSIATGKKLVEHGWATAFGTDISNDYWTTCDKPFPRSDSGVAVLYMPANSIGKICLRYYNPNNDPEPVYPPRIFDPNNSYQNTTNVTIWTYTPINTISKGNTTIVAYFIKTGNKTGFYGLSLPSCVATPFAVGYNNDSKIVPSDFPFLGVTVSCPAMLSGIQIDGMTGIGVKYIPYP